MNYVVLDQNVGKPWTGDLVWSALPDAPVQEERPRFVWLRALTKRVPNSRRVRVVARLSSR